MCVTGKGTPNRIRGLERAELGKAMREFLEVSLPACGGQLKRAAGFTQQGASGFVGGTSMPLTKPQTHA